MRRCGAGRSGTLPSTCPAMCRPRWSAAAWATAPKPWSWPGRTSPRPRAWARQKRCGSTSSMSRWEACWVGPALRCRPPALSTCCFPSARWAACPDTSSQASPAALRCARCGTGGRRAAVRPPHRQPAGLLQQEAALRHAAGGRGGGRGRRRRGQARQAPAQQQQVRFSRSGKVAVLGGCVGGLGCGWGVACVQPSGCLARSRPMVPGLQPCLPCHQPSTLSTRHLQPPPLPTPCCLHRRCFNCGSYGHTMRECWREHNRELVEESKRHVGLSWRHAELAPRCGMC